MSRGCRGIVVSLVALIGAWPHSAAAQDLKPKLLILFDTSGSMLADLNGTDMFTDDDYDGSPLCQNLGQNSRMYQLKVALFEALQGVGSTEMSFALETFPLRVDPSQVPSCPRGHYLTVPAQDSELYPGRGGCKITTHQATTQTTADCGTSACPWYPQLREEVLRVSFGEAPEKIMYWFDQQEDHPLTNPEVRAARWTPLGKSLFYAHGYFHKEVAMPVNDYRKKCERLVVAMFTDGQETCNDPAGNAFHPVTWATSLHKPGLGVVTHTVAIDVPVDEQQGLKDIAAAGHGTFYNVTGNTAALKTAFLDIIAKSQIPQETCNGEDDDCDNLVDEDFPLKGKGCNNGKLGACYQTGYYVCAPDGSGVVCNAPDATGSPEVCDGLDNDCDNEIDEIPGCLPCAAQPEVCNGKDDDCDTQIDEDIPSAPCGKDMGECKPGMTVCENGKTSCVGGTGPTEEVCDGLDNDCDGTRDGIAGLCYSYDTGCDLATGVCQGQCRLGQSWCTAVQSGGGWVGEWGACVGDVGPSEELCDGLDNDCDGVIDDQAECPGGSQCIAGECSSPCGGGEFVCPAGQLCKDGWCLLDRCDPQECYAGGGVCKAGECIDLCKDVTCPKYQKCERGNCVDDSCYKAHPCPPGQRCVDGACATDRCAGVSCESDEFCLDGRCLTLCDRMLCPAGQHCALVDDGDGKKTQCVADPCAGLDCSAGTVCKDGACVFDPCEAASCDTGEMCVDGSCVPDLCDLANCPPTYACEQGLCVSQAESVTNLLATGAGGCTCAIDGADGPPAAFFGLLACAALLGLRRRRSRR